MLKYKIDTPELRNILIEKQDDIVHLCIKAGITNLYICAPSDRSKVCKLNLYFEHGPRYSFEKEDMFVSEMEKILKENNLYVSPNKQRNIEVFVQSYNDIKKSIQRERENPKKRIVEDNMGITEKRYQPIISSAIPILELTDESINEQLQDRLKESKNIKLEQTSIISSPSVSSASNEENIIPSHVDNLNKRQKTKTPQLIQERPETQDEASDLKHTKSFTKIIENPNQNPQTTR